MGCLYVFMSIGCNLPHYLYLHLANMYIYIIDNPIVSDCGLGNYSLLILHYGKNQGVNHIAFKI